MSLTSPSVCSSHGLVSGAQGTTSGVQSGSFGTS